MQLNIIHLSSRTDRLHTLNNELNQQNISDFRIWPGISDEHLPCKGISKAHKQIVKYAQGNNLSEVLIAEDDLKFTDFGAFNFFLENKPSDYDLYLSSVYYGQIGENNIVDDFAGLTFYLINQRFYQKFLTVPEHDNLDRQLRGKGKFVVCNPFSVIQHNGFSDNHKRYCNYDNYLDNKMLFRRKL